MIVHIGGITLSIREDETVDEVPCPHCWRATIVIRKKTTPLEKAARYWTCDYCEKELVQKGKYHERQ